MIEIPVSESNAKVANGNIREPLLVVGDYAGASVSMVANPRFVPTLYSGVASRIGSPRWDQRPVVGIQIVPRSGSKTGNLVLDGDQRAAHASVRLADANVVPIVDKSAQALIASTVNGHPKNRFMDKPRVRCIVRLTEIYGDGKADQWSWCVALKVDDGDKDPWNKII